MPSPRTVGPFELANTVYFAVLPVSFVDLVLTKILSKTIELALCRRLRATTRVIGGAYVFPLADVTISSGGDKRALAVESASVLVNLKAR